MNPPSEQLVRDYLNRVSVAARGRLSPDDRRAFLARTREYIEMNTRGAGLTRTPEVLKFLSELPDPVTLVDTERERLAAGGEEPGSGATTDRSLAARARRLRETPANVASLLRTSAMAVAPGDTMPIPEPAQDHPMTGEVRFRTRLPVEGTVRRAVSSRFRPGEVLPPREERPRRPVIPRGLRPGAARRGAGAQSPPALPQVTEVAEVAEVAEPPETSAAPEAVLPLPADLDLDQDQAARPEWPSVTARRPAAPGEAEPAPEPEEPADDFAAERAERADTGLADTGLADTGFADTGPTDTGPTDDEAGDWAAPSAAELSWTVPADGGLGAVTSSSAPVGTGSSEPPGQIDNGTDPAAVVIPPRGARVTWASGVRSGAQRLSALRAAGSRRGGGPVGQEARAGEARAAADRGRDLAAAAWAATLKGARALARWAQAHRLEATAVVLLGLGGLIYPPVWLIGAVVALPSRIWDLRDKWIGVGLPVFLVIAGMIADVTLGPHHQHAGTYVRQAWMFGGHLSRILALLGACYLAWRADRGKRPVAVPPWRKHRRPR